MADTVELVLEGADVFPAKDLARLWAHAGALGLVFDQFSVANTYRPLGAQPLPTLTKWASKRGCRNLALTHTGSHEMVLLSRFKDATPDLRFRFPWGQRAPGPFLEQVVAMLDAWPFTSLKMDWDRGPKWLHSKDQVELGWLVGLNERQRQLLPEAKLKAAVAAAPGAFLLRGKHLTVVGLASGPDAGLSEQQLSARWARIEAIALGELERSLGLSFATTAEQALQAVLTPQGFTRSAGSNAREVIFQNGKLRVVATLRWLLQPDVEVQVDLEAKLEGSKPGSYYSLDLGEGPPDELKDVLEAGLESYARDSARWLKNPGKFRRRR
jgi:hypothetical protein